MPAAEEDDHPGGRPKGTFLGSWPVPGAGTLYYDWAAMGATETRRLPINGNGTWTSGEGYSYSGLWVQAAGMLIFTATASPPGLSSAQERPTLRFIAASLQATQSLGFREPTPEQSAASKAGGRRSHNSGSSEKV